ncbi:dehydrogenase/reductase SDR family member 11-like isoform X2 [Periplaneta americana]
MQRWAGRVAVVTGASSGIGAAITKELVKSGVKVVGLARRVERVEELSSKLSSEPGRLFAVKADITKESDIKEAFQWVKKNLGGVDILVNNAGVNIGNSLTEGPEEAWKGMFDLNVFALSSCTKEAVQSMKERNVDDGHIVHINSLLGHVIPPAEYSLFMYTASKHAVTALAEGLRRELVSQKSRIRVTSVSPGLVNTEFTTVSSKDHNPETMQQTHPHLQPEDLAAAVMYVLGTPPHVQVHELTLRPTGQVG